MPRNVPAELKLHAVKEYLDGKGSSYLVAEKHGVNRASFCAWVRKYQALGDTAFMRSGHNNAYTTGFKIKVVDEYLCGNDTPQSIV
jgi:transposase-like protein